jgi:hypothetical protein
VFGVQDSECVVWNLGFGVLGSGFSVRVKHIGLRV